jgi:cyclophilin family peptidyl-prolyl cis-trans isomerase
MKVFFTSLFIGGCFLLVGAGCAPSPLALTPTEEVPSSGAKSDATTTPMPQWTYQGQLPAERIAGKIARISTKYGNIVIRLFDDTAPLTVSNFVYLAEGGYYNGLTFHRREEGFVIQGGDPNGNGSGGPGYSFEDELNDDYAYDRGMVAMANRGPDTNGSQFFIMLDDAPLPKAYSVFGEVLEGMDVVDQVRKGDVMTTVVIEEDMSK